MKHTKVITFLIMVIFLPLSSYGNTCQGRFVNPITDICWSCLLPISIGGFNIGKGSSPKKRDILLVNEELQRQERYYKV
ncbi:MAG: TraU family protein [Rickettsia endosymbiont of Gnoriste bilineata]|nr:TraU family protein [Rickettsia endosymbiont of Gnoriste bilineata]